MILLLLAFEILLASGGSANVIRPTDSTQLIMQRIRESARQEPPGLGIQSLLAAAELLRPIDPGAADAFIRDCLAILKSGRPIDAQITTKIFEVAMQINPREALPQLPSLTDRRAVANALMSYYLRQGCPEKAVALIEASRGEGLGDLSGSILVLRQLIQQRPDDGEILFNKMLRWAPPTLDPEEALFLLRAVREVVLLNPRLALRAVLRIAASAQSSEFSRGFSGTFEAKYRIAGRDVWTSDIHESVLLPASVYLHVLAPDDDPGFAVGPKDERLLSAVTWQTLLKSTQPLQIVWLKSDSKRAPEAELTALAGPGFSSAEVSPRLPVRTEEGVSEESLDSLFDRLKQQEAAGRARGAIEREALEKIRSMAPDRQRVGAAAELLSLAAGRESAAKLEPITEFLLSSLAPLARGTLTSRIGDPEDAWCGSMYSFVASQIHQYHITSLENDPSLTTRLALLNLRDRLQEAYDFTLKDMNARQYTLRQFRGHVVVLRFWSAQSGTSLRSLTALEKLYRKNAKKSVAVLAIGEEAGTVTGFSPKMGDYTFPFLFDNDGAVSGYFGISVIPTTIVIDQNGRIVSSTVGDSPLAQLRQIIGKAKRR
jgi:peroxiredoxin